MHTKILLTGSSGFIGSNFATYITDYMPICTYNNNKVSFNNLNSYKCDLANITQCKNLIIKANPDIIFHFAGLTNPRRNDLFPSKSEKYNFFTTKNIVDCIKNLNKHIIFLSTDKVFDGSDAFPSENSKVKPLGYMGKYKAMSEDYIMDNIKKFHILRLPIVHDFGRSNINSFLDDAVIDIKNKKKVNVFKNVERCFVRIDELLELLKILISNKNYGLYNTGSKINTYYNRVIYMCEKINISYSGLIDSTIGNVLPVVQNLNTSKLKENINFNFS